MTYYRNKIKANIQITEMLDKKVPIPQICFIIANRYGFGDKIVRDRINLLIRMKPELKEILTPEDVEWLEK